MTLDELNCETTLSNTTSANDDELVLAEELRLLISQHCSIAQPCRWMTGRQCGRSQRRAARGTGCSLLKPWLSWMCGPFLVLGRLVWRSCSEELQLKGVSGVDLAFPCCRNGQSQVQQAVRKKLGGLVVVAGSCRGVCVSAKGGALRWPGEIGVSGGNGRKRRVTCTRRQRDLSLRNPAGWSLANGSGSWAGGESAGRAACDFACVFVQVVGRSEAHGAYRGRASVRTRGRKSGQFQCVRPTQVQQVEREKGYSSELHPSGRCALAAGGRPVTGAAPSPAMIEPRSGNGKHTGVCVHTHDRSPSSEALPLRSPLGNLPSTQGLSLRAQESTLFSAGQAAALLSPTIVTTRQSSGQGCVSWGRVRSMPMPHARPYSAAQSMSAR